MSEIDKIRDEHLTLSISIGKPIGLMIKEPGSFTYPTMICEDILNAIYQGKWDEMKLSSEFLENTYGRTILHFLRSKDDSLLLLITSLIYNFTMSDNIDPSILFESNLYPIGQR